VHEAGFGQCQDCGEDISFDRLKVEPWAHRCLACATAAEQAGPRGTRHAHR
jgi:RNA polymerase-binding transcription factor DksA